MGKLPEVKITIDAGPDTISFVLKGVTVDVSRVMQFLKIQMSSHTSSVRCTLVEHDIGFSHVRRVGAATVVKDAEDAEA